MKIAEDITQLVGNTPLVKLNKVTEGCLATIVGKLEFYNPCSSVKDRVGFSLIDNAEKKGLLDTDTVVIEPTSGNTGIALAFICAVRGYKLIITMPESMSPDKKKVLKAFGAEVDLTPAHLGMAGAIDRANFLAKKQKNTFIPHQFQNNDNPEIHRLTTAEEIWNDTDGKVDILVAGVGTGGTITGISEVIKQRKTDFKAIAVEPKGSAVLSGGESGLHMLQGMGAGFIPDVLNIEIIDEVIKVSNEEAFNMTRRLVREEGIFCGISSGAIVKAAIDVAKREVNKDKLIVAIICDTAERYLSTNLFND